MDQACPLSPFCLGMHEYCCQGQQKNSAFEVSTHKEMVASDACCSATASARPLALAAAVEPLPHPNASPNLSTSKNWLNLAKVLNQRTQPRVLSGH